MNRELKTPLLEGEGGPRSGSGEVLTPETEAPFIKRNSLRHCVNYGSSSPSSVGFADTFSRREKDLIGESLMLRKLYDWIVALSARPSAPWALAAVAFAESSFFIIPPDVMLAPMALARPERAWHYALVCTLGSVFGGMFGYAIGHLLFDSVGMWILDLYNLGGKVETIKEAYAKWGALLILLKGLTPIPFKLVTIVSGALDYNFPLFVLLCFITRGARFFLLAGLLNKFGGPMRTFIENRVGLVVGGMVAIFVIGLIVAAKLA